MNRSEDETISVPGCVGGWGGPGVVTYTNAQREEANKITSNFNYNIIFSFVQVVFSHLMRRACWRRHK